MKSKLVIIMSLFCFFSLSYSCPAQNGLPLDLMQKFAPDMYYIAHFDGKEYVVKQDAFGVKKCKFSFYDANNENMVAPESFQIKVKKNRCILVYHDKEVSAKEFEYRYDEFTWRGTCLMDGRKVSFDFTEYRNEDFVTFTRRYKDKIFNYTVEKDLVYGHASGYWISNLVDTSNYLHVVLSGIKKKELDLTMDLYLPQYDQLEARPLLMLLHGGAFYIGDKEETPIVEWSKHFASLGYVVAAVNYRMGFKLSKKDIERCCYGALQDAHAAMRYLLENKDIYHIDPDNLFVAGSSAGGITALNLAFMQNEDRPESTFKHLHSQDLGNIESSGNDIKQTFQIRAVGNMCGAVNDLSILKNRRTDVVSFHGNADKIVPYDSGASLAMLKYDMNELFFNEMYGSAAIHRELKELCYREKLYTFDGAGHAPNVDKEKHPNDRFYFIQEKMADFFYDEIVSPDISLQLFENQFYKLANVPEVEQMYWKVEGGFILEKTVDGVRVLWRKDMTKHSLHVSGKLKNGATIDLTFSPEK